MYENLKNVWKVRRKKTKVGKGEKKTSESKTSEKSDIKNNKSQKINRQNTSTLTSVGQQTLPIEEARSGTQITWGKTKNGKKPKTWKSKKRNWKQKLTWAFGHAAKVTAKLFEDYLLCVWSQFVVVYCRSLVYLVIFFSLSLMSVCYILIN